MYNLTNACAAARFQQWWGQSAPKCPSGAPCSHSQAGNTVGLEWKVPSLWWRSEVPHAGSGSQFPRGTTDLFLAVRFLILLPFWVYKS